MHTLISGQSFSGKSFLAKRLCSQLRKKRLCLVLDPFLDDWDCDVKTDNPDYFLSVAKANKSCALFVDESGSTIGRGADARRLHWLATMSRHWGHRTYFILQRINQIEPLLRSQCSEFFAFRGSASDAKILVDETGQKIFEKIPELPRHAFIHAVPFGVPQIQILK